ncbi:hypothetical protein [Labrys neptuniae]
MAQLARSVGWGALATVWIAAACTFAQPARADDVITDIAGWHHPTKSVFAKHHLELTRVVITQNGKFPIFHVKFFPASPLLAINDPFFRPLEIDALLANGKWPLRIVSDNGFRCAIDVSWDRAHKTMNEQVDGDDC